MAPYQVGKKEVIRWEDNRVTGNLVATLQAMEALGGEFKSNGDLLPFVRRNERFSLDTNKTDSVRGQLRWLREKGLVDDKRLTDLGSRMARAVKVLEHNEPQPPSPQEAPS